MPDPEWPCSPPEANYLRLAGVGAAGAATTLASAAAWQALVASAEAAFSMSAMNTVATAANFEGVGGLSSSTAVTGLNAALQLLAGWAQGKPPIAADAVSAYQAAVSSMIPAEVCLANRAEQAADVAMNPLVLGALTPAIVALDAEYFGEHWPHNAGAGSAYGAALAALAAALALPPPLSPPGASPAGPAAAAAAVAQSTGRLAAGETMRESGDVLNNATDAAADTPSAPAAMAGQVSQLGSMLTQPLQSAAGMFQYPMQALSGVMSLPQSLLGQRTGGLGAAAEPADDDLLVEDPVPGAVVTGTGTAAGVTGSAGSPTLPAGGMPGAGITSYTKPSSGFSPDVGGRPVARTGLLSAAAELKEPTVAGPAGAVPLPGKVVPSDRDESKRVVAQAQIMTDGDHLQG